MNKTTKIAISILLILFFAFTFAAIVLIRSARGAEVLKMPAVLAPNTVVVTDQVQDAELEVARVFGRVPACADTDKVLIRQVAVASVRHGIDPRVYAALIGTESGCNPLAVSTRGAIGLVQVMPRIWSKQFDIERRYNLFNPEDSLEVGAGILQPMVRQYGYAQALRRYNGLGVGCDTCDGGYADRIISLAGHHGA